jgi:Icc-related predicted phosphoesterase
MRFVFLSDTHGLHDKIEVPEGDVLIHCGDFSGCGTERDLREFNRWLGELPHPNKLVTPGNHDFICEEEPERSREILSNGILLMDQEISLNGIRIYLAPWSPEFGRWAFMLPRGAGMRSVWSKIPSGIDVLVTHAPPISILDQVDYFHPRRREWELLSVGCADLYTKVMEIKPRIHAFGHIHEGYGRSEKNGIQFVNASSCDKHYRPVNPPIVIDL